MDKNINKDMVYNLLPERPVDANKGTFGRILNIAGSSRYIGAAYLSSISALKIGAGFVLLACPETIISSVVSLSPEITFLPLKEQNFEEISEELKKADIISIGCGLTTNDSAQKLVQNVLKHRNESQKIILDADGINILALLKEEISLKNSVITPHPKELSRLLDVDLNEILENKEKYARIAAKKFDCITVLKGHKTIITDGNDIYVNETESSALAKAGSGDVLTGIISGLAAQNLTLWEASAAGVFIHGLSGDIAAEDLSEYCVLASDTIDYIPFAINEILSEN